MYGLIWLIIIGAIIGNLLKQQSAKNTGEKRSWIPGPGSGAKNEGNQPVQPAGDQRRTPRPNITNDGYRARPDMGENIISDRVNSRARENERNMQDKIEINAAHDLDAENYFTEVVDLSKAGENMRQVSDLIIRGYQEDLTFDRDFVSEGIEMLNRFANDESSIGGRGRQ